MPLFSVSIVHNDNVYRDWMLPPILFFYKNLDSKLKFSVMFGKNSDVILARKSCGE